MKIIIHELSCDIDIIKDNWVDMIRDEIEAAKAEIQKLEQQHMDVDKVIDRISQQEDVKKAAPKKSNKKIDRGKVKALAEGGWTPQEIADEMQCSLQTAYNALNELGLKEEK